MTTHRAVSSETLSVERLEARYALSALGLNLPVLAPLLPVLSPITVETTVLGSSGSGSGSSTTVLGANVGLGSAVSLGTELSLGAGGGSSGLPVLGAQTSGSVLGQSIGVQAGVGQGGGALDLGAQISVSAPLIGQASLGTSVGVGGSGGLLDVGLGASVGQLLQANVNVGGSELLGLAVAAQLGPGLNVNLDGGLGGSEGGGWIDLGVGDIVSGGLGPGGGEVVIGGIPVIPSLPSTGDAFVSNAAQGDGGGQFVFEEGDVAAEENDDTVIGAPGDDDLLFDAIAEEEEETSLTGSGTDPEGMADSFNNSALMGRALPMLLAPNLAAHGVPDIAADLVEMAAVANAAELAAFESALAQFLGELEALEAEMAAADLGLVPWILTASVATIAAGEIVRRERRARKTRPQTNVPPGLLLA